MMRGDVVDGGMVVVIPVKVSFEISDGLGVIQELAGILRRALRGGKRRFDERILIGGARAGKQVGHLVILAQLSDRLGFHLAAPVVEEFGPLVLRQVQNVLLAQPAFEQQAGLGGRLRPTDAPLDGLAGELIKEQVEIEIQPFLERQQVADIPAPPLVGPGEDLADRGQ